MFNKLFGFSGIVLMTALLLLTSCEENLLNEASEIDGAAKSAQNEDLIGFEGRTGPLGKAKCFELIFPVTLLDEEGEIVGEATTQQEFKNLIREWKYAEGRKAKLQIEMPYDVLLDDGTTHSVASEEDAMALKEACAELGFAKECGNKPHLGFKCYTTVFPISFTMPDGSSISAESKEDAREQLTTWKENNPDVAGHPALNFPIQLIKDDGTELTINSREELKDLRGTCNEEAE